MTTPTPPPAGTGTPLWVRIALIVSVSVNLLILGALIGAGFAGRGPDDRRPEAGLRGAVPFVMALEPEDRRVVAGRMRAGAAELSDNRRAMRARFGAFLDALRADEFDRPVIEGLLGDQRATATQRQRIGEAILLDHLAGMTAAERRAYADRLESSLRRAFGRR